MCQNEPPGLDSTPYPQPQPAPPLPAGRHHASFLLLVKPARRCRHSAAAAAALAAASGLASLERRCPQAGVTPSRNLCTQTHLLCRRLGRRQRLFCLRECRREPRVRRRGAETLLRLLGGAAQLQPSRRQVPADVKHKFMFQNLRSVSGLCTGSCLLCPGTGESARSDTAAAFTRCLGPLHTAIACTQTAPGKEAALLAPT